MSVAGVLLGLLILVGVGTAWTIVATYRAALRRDLRVCAVISTFLVWLIIAELAYAGIADPTLHPTLYGWMWLVLATGASIFAPLIIGLLENAADRRGLDTAWSVVIGASIGGGVTVVLFLAVFPMLFGWFHWIRIAIPSPLPSPF